MFDKEYSDTPVKEKLELISYQPGLQDTGDLEAATKTITATAEASGLANADYSASLTLSKPADARLVVKKICARLQVTIDTIPSGDTNLYCRVYVDAQATANRLFDLSWNSTGAKLSAVDTHLANLSTIFDLLKNGSSHTFYFFFWKAGTGTGIIISCVQLWEGVGTCIPGAGTLVMLLTHTGGLSGFMIANKSGTGTVNSRVTFGNTVYYVYSGATEFAIPNTFGIDFGFCVNGTVATDLNYVGLVLLNLRSEQ